MDLAVAGIEEIAVPEPTYSRVAVFYRPELDGLRFGAFVMVFLCHTFLRRGVKTARVRSRQFLGMFLRW